MKLNPLVIPIQIDKIRNNTTGTTTPPQPKSGHSTSMTIVTTISITAVCIAAILVISALLILKLRRPALSPIKVEEIKACGGGDTCSNSRNVQNSSQSYPEYQFVASEDHEHTTSVVVWDAVCTCCAHVLHCSQSYLHVVLVSAHVVGCFY